MSEQGQRDPHKDPPPPTRAQRLAAFGFLGAFGLTILTVLLTGLSVGAPSARHLMQPVPSVPDPRAPSAKADAPPRWSSAAPAVPVPSAAEPHTVDQPSREDAARDPDDALRKDSHKGAADSRANDSR